LTELTNNQIRDFTEFDGLNKLEYLFLDNNRIISIKSNQFQNLSNLIKLLNLEKNSIQATDSTVFTYLLNINDLRLSDNKIQSISLDSFKNLVHLQFFNSNNNSISSLPLTNNQLKSIEYIWLSNNQLKSIESDTFKYFVSLKQLGLESNELISVNRNADLTNLERVCIYFRIRFQSYFQIK